MIKCLKVQNIDEEDEEIEDQYEEDGEEYEEQEEEVVEDPDNQRTSPTPLVQDQPVFIEYGKNNGNY